MACSLLHYLCYEWKPMKSSTEAVEASVKAFMGAMEASTGVFFSRMLPQIVRRSFPGSSFHESFRGSFHGSSESFPRKPLPWNLATSTTFMETSVEASTKAFEILARRLLLTSKDSTETSTKSFRGSCFDGILLFYFHGSFCGSFHRSSAASTTASTESHFHGSFRGSN